jgi:peptidoglycan-associated lipoprotein
MRNFRRKFLFSSLLLFFLASCVGEVPIEPPKRGFYKNEPVVFKSSCDEVWSATIMAVGELGWDIEKADKEKGEIELITSYVYNSYFEKYERVYVEPTNVQLEKSRVSPYLRKISYYEKITPPPAPPNPKFVKENLGIKVTSLSTMETEVKVSYKIAPYYDYKIGYLGTVRSNGRFEKDLFKRINEILTEEEAPPPPPQPVEVEVKLTDIFFDFDRYDIRPDAVPVLQENAEVLKNNPELTILIEGYADIRGTDEYNLRLGQRRAEAAKAYLVSLGVDPARIQTVSKGETTKFAVGTTEEAYQLNRRAHFLPIRPGFAPGARIMLKKKSQPFL